MLSVLLPLFHGPPKLCLKTECLVVPTNFYFHSLDGHLYCTTPEKETKDGHTHHLLNICNTKLRKCIIVGIT